ncbi:GIY-YIG nuclease family protein [Muriicola sp.]|uniref:GIY-YIG nuclease family protein n=1 Tax=Muriicola sp. TaxID=2020856 RepID=UPI003562A79E
MIWVYAIRSISYEYIYVGMTSNLEDRLRRHNRGWEKTTRPYAPFFLIYKEECANRKLARQREKYWKSGSGKEKLKIL